MDFIGNYIGIIVTGIFSFLLWKTSIKSADAAKGSATATEESVKVAIKSVEIAEKTLSFYKQQQEKLDTERSIMSREYQDRFLKEARYLYNILRGIGDGKPNLVAIQKGYYINLPTPREFAEFFKDEQIECIKKIWQIYLDHYSSSWMEHDTGEVTRLKYDTDPNVKKEAYKASNELAEQLMKLESYGKLY